VGADPFVDYQAKPKRRAKRLDQRPKKPRAPLREGLPLRLLPEPSRYPTPYRNYYASQQPKRGEQANIDGKQNPGVRIEVVHLTRE
jgi:hypothetical protein